MVNSVAPGGGSDWCSLSFFFFFNDTATTEIYTLSLHDALPICSNAEADSLLESTPDPNSGSQDHQDDSVQGSVRGDRKSTRLNSSHVKRSRMPSSA